MSKKVLVILGLLLAAICGAQVSAQEDDFVITSDAGAHEVLWDGQIIYLPVIVNGTTTNMPVQITTNTWTLDTSWWGTTRKFLVELVQTKKYVGNPDGQGGNYYPITPRSCWDAGSVVGQNASSVGSTATGGTNIWDRFMRFIKSQSDTSYRTGEYVLRVQIWDNSSAIASHSFTFAMIDWNMIYGQTYGEGGIPGVPPGVGANDPTVEGQQGFWESIFVPDEACLNDVRDAASAFTEWGPLGLFHQACEALDSQEALDASADLPIQLGGDVIASHNAAVDTTPWEGVLGTFRALLAGAIWFGAIWSGWTLARKLMVGG